MSANRYDSIIIGAGHNGLVAAAYLARAGLQVMVLERRQVLGGAASTEEIFPGFKVDTGAWEAGLFLPDILADLQLSKYGLKFLESEALIHAPQPDGSALTLWRDTQRSVAEIARFSKRDAERYPAFVRRSSRLARLLHATFPLTPPTVPEVHYSELVPWLRVGLQARRMGSREMMELLRVLPMPVADYLDEWFETPALKAALGSAGITGTMLGPKAAGTALLFLYHWMEDGADGAGAGGLHLGRFVQGGMGELAGALASAARQFGAEICIATEIKEIIVQDGQAAGVVLDDGRKIFARALLSSANPRHTFFDLVGAQHLEVRFVREVKNIRYRGCLARVNLALAGLPRAWEQPGDEPSPGSNTHLSGHIRICPDLEYLERAYDDAKYGSFSQSPYLDMVIPSLVDSSLAPSGKHLMCINVQHAPYYLEQGDWDGQREQLGDRVVQILETFAPGIRELILERQILTPLDLERKFGLPEGNIHHGEMALDQLFFMRPVPGSSQYHTPVENLFLCGAGAHPGGGVTGAPGYNAAREVLQHLKRNQSGAKPG